MISADHEMTTLKESQNGKPKASLVSASTQTQLNNNKADSVSSPCRDESLESAENMLNSSKIGNGPLLARQQSDSIPL